MVLLAVLMAAAILQISAKAETELEEESGYTVSYEWIQTDTGYDCTGTAVNSESENSITETVSAVISSHVDAACETPDSTTYTAAFTDPVFETQYNTITGTVLGHIWLYDSITWEETADGYEAAVNFHCDRCSKAESLSAEMDIQETPATTYETGVRVYTASITAEDSLDGQIHSDVMEVILYPEYVILTQPEAVITAAGNAIQFSVETNLPETDYQWQYSKDGGSSWINSPSPGNKTATVTVNTNSSMDGRLYRCQITLDDTVLITNAVTLTIKRITTQPTAQTVIQGEAAEFSVDINVQDASYQWQYSKDGGSTWVNSPSSGNKSKKVHVNTNAGLNGRLYRCVVTCGSDELISKSAKLTVQGIKTQPTATTVTVGTKAVFIVKTTTEGAVYQWQYSTNNGSTWQSSTSEGNTTDTIRINSAASMNGRMYRCRITYGNTVLTTNAVKLTVKGIKTQPTAQTTIHGEKAVFSIETTVTGATFQWQYSTDNGKTWINSPSSGNKGKKLTVNTNANMNGRLYRCQVTYGSTVLSSKTAKLTVKGIKTQPTAQTVIVGGQALFKLTTTVSGASYQWQYSTDNGKTWVNSPSSGNKTSKVTVNTNLGMNGRLYRCQVTYGNTVLISNSASLTIQGIKTQPSAQTSVSGNNAIFTVTLTTTAGAAYQWQYSEDGGTTWVNSSSSGNRTKSVTVSTNTGMNGHLYRCQITYGSTVLTTNAVKLTVQGIKNQPADKTALLGSTAVFKVTTTTSGANYQWQYSTNNGSTWTLLSGCTTDTISINATAALNNSLFQCLVSFGGTTLKTNAARLTVYGITSHPTDQSVVQGGTVTFSVGTIGSGAVYQWQYSSNNGGSWMNASSSGSSASTISVLANTAGMDGRMYRCQVTFGNTTVYSNSARLTVKGISSQPTSQTVSEKEYAYFYVGTTAPGATFLWQYSPNNGSTWYPTEATTSSYQVYGDKAKNGYLYRCQVTYGGSIFMSNTVSLTIQKETFLLNTHTKKFHKTTCGSGQSAASYNKKIVTCYRSDLIEQGYSPCGNCKP